MLHFQVQKSKIDTFNWLQEEIPTADSLDENEVLFALDAFSFTANNITYASLGDAFQYWKFFSPEGNYGRIPCWGFANVIASKATGINVGDRYYGYFPMSSHLKVKAGKIQTSSFFDVSEHRLKLPMVYNQYSKSDEKGGNEAFQMLFRPLFTTSFLLADYLSEVDFFNAKQIVLTSASSKTALGLAFLLKQLKKELNADFNIVGLTSFGNVYFVSETGYYDSVIDYNDIEAIKQEDAVIVDFAGNKSTLLAVDKQVDGKLKKVVTVGKSHWDSEVSTDKLSVKPELFFAPAQAQKRLAEWGSKVFSNNLSSKMRAFYQSTTNWLKYVDVNSKSDWELIYKHCLNGGFNPETGYIVNIGQF